MGFHRKKCPKLPRNPSIELLNGFSPTSKSFTDEEALLLPEFNELIQKEFDETGCFATSDVMGAVSPLVREMESVEPKRTDENTRVMEQEIMELQNMVQELQDRERNLVAQLLEYYGLKEQDAIVRELQNRLKVNTMETQLFTLKIESLHAENALTLDLKSLRLRLRSLFLPFIRTKLQKYAYKANKASSI